MGSLAAFLGSMAVSLPSRVLAALGIGFISMAGYSTVITGLISTFQGTWASLGADILSYLTLGGFTTGLGLILGALVMRLALTSLTSLGKLS